MSAVSAIAVLAIGLMITLGCCSIAMGQDQQQQQSGQINKEDFLRFQNDMYSTMQRYGLNPGQVMVGKDMSQQDWVNLHRDMWDLMERYGMNPSMMMKKGMCM